MTKASEELVKIHYCWFGGNPLPTNVIKCIESWKKYCPNLQIKEWNESNFDFSDCSFAVDAYKAKKWAFVSDYARAKILYENGGLFLDTDVELIKSLDELMDNTFMGFENDSYVNPGLIMYAKNPRNDFFRCVFEKYHTINFDEQNLASITSPMIYTQILLERGLRADGSMQTVNDIKIYPREWFSPIPGKLNSNSHSIHHYDGSWLSNDEREYFLIRHKYGQKLGRILYTFKHPIKAFKRLIKNNANRSRVND